MEAKDRVLYKGPCECGSSDARAVYEDLHEHCFSCGDHKHPPREGEAKAETRPKERNMLGLIEGEVHPLGNRGISAETCRHYSYEVGTHNGVPVQIANYYDADGKKVAQKIRFPPDPVTGKKDFKVFGSLDTALPFGATKFPRGGKRVVLVEGEVDALSGGSMYGLAWPVLSIATGADRPKNDKGEPLPMNGIRKYIAKHRDFLNQWDEVVICFDSDEAGRASARVAAEVIGAKAKVAELPLKDLNEMLMAGRTEEALRCIYNAQKHHPEGIVLGSQLLEAMLQKPQKGLEWAYPSLNRIHHGKRLGEIVTIGAGTGSGKTDFLTQDMVHMLDVHGEDIGVFAMEQHPNETTLRMVGKHRQKLLIDPEQWDHEEIKAGHESLFRKAESYLWSHFGANDFERISNRIEYLAQAHGVRYFYLDHLTALVAQADDERRELDSLMEKLSSTAQRLNIHITVVSHLSRPRGTPHEEGGEVSQAHFRGSQSIAQWSHLMIGLRRHQLHPDETIRNTMQVVVIKDRFFGRTGQSFFLRFDSETGVLSEVERPESGIETEQAARSHGFKREQGASAAQVANTAETHDY